MGEGRGWDNVIFDLNIFFKYCTEYLGRSIPHPKLENY
jgi:hypothetical protein